MIKMNGNKKFKEIYDKFVGVMANSLKNTSGYLMS